jgi:hypothetical protein
MTTKGVEVVVGAINIIKVVVEERFREKEEGTLTAF